MFSLNVNQNAQWTVANILPMEWIWYPDFTQILIKPSFWYITSVPEPVETVKGTPIHNLSSDINSENWNGTWAYVGVWQDANIFWTNIWPIRVATKRELSWGELVGREIVWGCVWGGDPTSWAITLKIWLLRKDGSIQYIWTITRSKKETNKQWWPISNGGAYIYVHIKDLYVLRSNWVRAVKWDRVIVDITATNNSQGWYVGFWTDWGSLLIARYTDSINKLVLQAPCCPIQVSIE